MADDDNDDDIEEDEDGEGGDEEDGESKTGSRKRLLIIVGLAFFLIVGGAAAAFFTGVLDPLLGGAEKGNVAEGEGEEKEEPEPGETVFFDLEEMLVNLNTGQRKSTFLKIRVALELSSEDDIERIKAVMPRIVDNFQVYLRELRIEDLRGSAGMYRLREELLARVNAAAFPAKVQDVLFKEMLVQ